MGLVRFLLAFSVLVAHSPFASQFMVPAEIAVQMFFVISGFYMTMILNTKYGNRTLTFYKNRALRLYPIYLFVVVLVVSAGSLSEFLFRFRLNNWNSAWDFYREGHLSLLSFLYVNFMNLTMFCQDSVMYLKIRSGDFVLGYFGDSNPPVHDFLLVPQAWSLSLELMFYGLAPFLVKNRRRVLIVLLLSVAVRVSLHLVGRSGDPFSYRFFPNEISVFLLGSLSWHFFRQHNISFVARHINKLLVGFLTSLVAWPLLFQFNDISRYFVLAFFALFVPYLFERFKDNRVDRAIGEMSYPFYLVHLFALQFCSALVRASGLSEPWLSATSLLAAAIAAVVASWLLAGPFQRYFEIRRTANLMKITNR